MSADDMKAKGVAGVAGTARTRTGSGVIEDWIYESPVDIREMRTRRIAFWGSVVVLAGLIVYAIAV